MGQRPDIEAIYPLSPMQEGMLFHILEQPGSEVYISQASWILPAGFDADALKLAWQRVLERHPVLRTAFTWQGLENPLQVVHRRLPLPWEEEVWSEATAEDCTRRLQAFMADDRRRGFVLSQAPVLRLTLIRLADGAFAFVWTYLHLLLDGWSSRLVMREILDCWQAEVVGDSAEFEPIRPFKDYITWLKRQDTSRAEGFWRRYLDGFDAPTTLPGSIDSPADGDSGASSDRGQHEAALILSPRTTEGLHVLRRRHGLTLNTLIQGAWALLLARHSGCRDVVFGATVSGRPATLPGAESIAGLFINTLPVRAEITAGERTVDWLLRLQATQAELRQYDYCPLVRVREWSELANDQSLFDSLLVFENYPVDERVRDGGGLGIRQVQAFESSNFPLNVIVSPVPQLQIAVHYATDRFAGTTIRRVLAHLETLFSELATEPQRRVGDLPLLTPAERHQIRSEWNDAGWDVTGLQEAKTVDELFAAQAASTPDAIALGSARSAVTFGALRRRVDGLAARLGQLGVGPEVRVGLVASRSAAAILGRLAILRAGGAFVPLDPKLPRQRLAFLLVDAGVEVVLAEPAFGARLEQFGVHVVALGEGAAEGSSDSCLVSRVVASHPAYVIYTSGTTGQPKGVLVSHRALVHLARAHARGAGIDCGRRVLHLTAPGFDVSVQETVASLCVGATVCLGTEEELALGPKLDASLRCLRVGVLTLTPPVLEELVVSDLPNLETLIVGGEACPPDLALRWARGRELVYEYGPSEATVTATLARSADGPRTDVGRPLDQVAIYLIDADGSLTVPGAAGEILIGGAGVGRGYVDRPARTAESFVPDAFSGLAGERLYRTGDLGRQRSDGRLEISGRLDQQLKVRGVRIEPGEVEAALRRHVDLREAAVLGLAGTGGKTQLAAYLAPIGSRTPSAADLRRFLRQSLPESMVPSAFVALERLPRTPNGKLDRRAMAELSGTDTAPDRSYVAPRGSTEEGVAQLFGEVLGLETSDKARIGRDSDFLELGGHSLLGVRLASRIRQSFAVELTLRELFEQLTVAGVARRIEIAQRAGAGLDLPPLVPFNGRQAPLSFAQERLWFLDQLAPGSPAYNMPLAVRLEGPLASNALERALHEIVRRHEVLRTRFVDRDGSPSQVIDPRVDLALPRIALERLPIDQREVVALNLVQQMARQPFDLQQGPVLRAALLRLAAEEHLLFVAMHHIVTDGWSMQILVAEVSALYQAFASDLPSPLPELDVQYAAFSAWQRDWLTGEVLERQLDFWRQTLGHGTHVLDLPLDRPRQPKAVRRGALVPVVVPASTATGLASLARRCRATRFVTLLAAFQGLLHRYSGQASITVGTPTAGRNHRRIEDLIGFFVNTLVLRTDLSGDPSFVDLLTRVREATFAAYAHQDLPFESLVDALQLPRDLSHSPLFQAMLSFEVDPAGSAIQLANLISRPVTVDTGSARFDLTLDLAASPTHIAGHLEYDRDLFDAATANRMAGHLGNLLRAIVATPEERLSRLPLLSAVERQQMTEWSDTATIAQPVGRIEARFEDQARRCPDAVALVFGEESLSYRELDRQAERLAARLRLAGVDREALVGLCVDRSPRMVVALLAVLKAGGAYLPLDRSYPDDRIASMLEDALHGFERPVVVAEPSDAVRLSGLTRLPLSYVSPRPLASMATAHRLDNPGRRGASDRAYVIYTSGSTGRPKGVEITHRAAVNFLDSMQQRPGLERQDVLLAVTTLSFDIALLEIFLPLLCGGRLVLADRATAIAADRLSDALRRHGASVMQATPATWQMLVDDGWQGRPNLRLLSGGEALPAPLAERLVARGRELWNLYGPTETTVWSTLRRVRRGIDTSPIGRPIANTDTVVLGRHLELSAVGVLGELHIGGAGVARGYLGRPALTATKFVPDPAQRARPGSRLYKTGDLATWNAAGELEFAGRIDHQVKVRGFRIELGEIESVLRRHSEVSEAAVVAQGEASDRRLVAFLVPVRSEAPPVDSDLRRFLGAQLPQYMLPTAYVELAELPLTANRKVDRRALLALGVPSVDHPIQGGTAPGSMVEEIVAGAFAEVLGATSLGVDANFFELGGHSLAATRVLARLRQVLGKEIPLRELFEYPTVAALARRLEDAADAGTAPIRRTERDQRIPLAFSQERLWLVDQLEPGNAAYNVPVGLLLEGSLSICHLAAALNEVVQRHEILRTHYAASQGRPAQLIQPSAPLGLPVVDLGRLPDRERQRVAESQALEEAARPFDLVQGPVFRVQLLKLGPREHHLLATAHHIACDEDSMATLVRETSLLYEAAVGDRPSPLPEPELQYADYAVWQRSAATSERLETELAYWRRVLHGAPKLLALPTDRPRPAIRTERGASQHFELAEELAPALAALAQRRGVTLFMTLLAAFQALLSRYSSQRDLCVGVPVGGRSHLELEGMVGFFVNLVAIRTVLTSQFRFGESLLRTRQGVLEAHRNRLLPFERLVDALELPRDLSHSPLFQAFFNFHNAAADDFRFAGLQLRPLAVDAPAARFDLSLSMRGDAASLSGLFSFSSDLFDRTTITRLSSHFDTLLRGLIDDPDQPIASLPLLDRPERQQMLAEWNDRSIDAEPARLVHRLFATQVEATPEATAVVFGSVQLTYAELARRVTRLAARLQDWGVGPDVRVGLCQQRSPAMVISMLGIVEAGGAYVPLDPANPRRRLAWLLADAEILVLLTDAATRETLPQLDGLNVVAVDEQSFDRGAAQPRRPPTEGLSADVDQLAYVIYTSGSTGRPKGVQVTHRGVANLAAAQQRAFGAASGDRVLQFSSSSFDASFFEILMALVGGAALHLATADELLPGPELGELLLARRITHLTIPPSALAALPPRDLPALRVLVVAGEALGGDLVRRWADGRRLFNAYGPTEATVWSTARVCDAADDDLTIGRPISGVESHLLDRALRPTPQGVAGELCLGGIGLARGYLQRPALTARVFVPHPLAEAPGERLYRSGDLARYRADGEVDFLGRIDHQAKIRGFRIETGEVEAALEAHPGVGEAVVEVREDVPGARRLVAYFVAAGEPPSSEALRSFLAETLPGYMLPAAFVVLDAMPLTVNRKVDRRALPAPSSDRPLLEGAFEAPENAAEQRLAAIWGEVLGVDRVGLKDNFFELGGDSILAIQVVTRASQAGLQLSARQLFQHPTVSELAALAGAAEDRPVEQGPVTGAVPLTPVQRWFFSLGSATPQHFNQAVFLRLAPAVTASRVGRAAERLVRHHDALRLRYARSTAGWQQEIVPMDGAAPVVRIDLSRLADGPGASLEAAAAQLQAGLDLEQGPVIRFAHFELSGGPDRLLIVAHHLVIDGVSWRILLADFEGLLADGDLPPKATSFKQWAELLEEAGRSDSVRDELDFWCDAMWPADLGDESFQLPVDHSAGVQANTVASAREIGLSLGRETTRVLLQEVPRLYGASVQHALLVALCRACEKWTGQSALLLDLEGHGRDPGRVAELDGRLDLSRTVGWFTTLYPVLFDLRQASEVTEALATVREQLTRVPGGGRGYGLLRFLGDRRITRQLRALPEAELSFNYHGQLDQTLATDSMLSLAQESTGRSQAPADLRPHILEVGALVADGRLQLTLGYSESLHCRQTIENLGRDISAALEQMAAGAGGGVWLPDIRLPQEDLQAALAAVRFAGHSVEGPGAEAAGLEDAYFLSPMQEGLLFHNLYEGDAGFYVTQLACRLRGLDIETFAGAWQRVVDHEPVLRTAISWSASERPIQVVGRRLELPLTVDDWRDLAPEDQDRRFDRLIDSERQRGFDLSEAPLMRLQLVRLSADTYRLLWSHHHILLDGWSVPLLLGEIFFAYGSLARGQELRLPQRRPFRDYISWLESREPAAAERFWRGALQGFVVPTPLAVDRPTERAAGHATVQCEMSPRRTDEVKQWAREHRVTVSTLVQGAWAVLLARYSGEPEVLFGSVESGRPPELDGVESMIGLFINTLPVRTTVADTDSIREWLGRFQDTQVRQREYVYTPLAQIRKWSEVPADQALFESLVAFENYPLDDSLGQQAGALDLSDVRPLDSTHFPLTLTASGADRLALRLELDRQRIDPTAGQRLLGHLSTLLLALTEGARQCLGELSLLSAGERHQLLELNATRVTYPQNLTIPAMFAAQVRRTPDTTALVFEQQVVTYAELAQRVGAMAQCLRRAGVGPEERVGICLERSPELVVGLLAILEAGTAYVPLDPSFPQERLAFMLADSDVRALLTSRELSHRLAAAGLTPPATAATLLVDSLDAPPANSPIDTATTHTDPINEAALGGSTVADTSLAYSIYTSGSTGRPKGTMNAHRGVVNRLLWMQQTHGLDRSDRVLQKTPFSFDVSVWEFFWPLAHGAALVIARPDGHRDPDYLADLIASERITTLHFVPSMLRAFLETPNLSARCDVLRRVIASGEALSRDLVDAFDQSLAADLHNLYGPTEAAVDVTFEPCVPAAADEAVAIGRPVANTAIHLLDPAGRPVPLGVPGELVIGGVQVGRGYLDRPALTAERFTPDGLSDGTGARLYRTGDLACYLADGRVEFLGRIDFQVKIHGQRIELGEIEAALNALPSVARSVVVARRESAARSRLVAYVVAAGDAPNQSELRTVLGKKLPAYMVPGGFVFLPALPLTPSGKLDRRALPEPEAAATERTGAFVAPRSAGEQQLVTIWGEVLGLDRIGIRDNFFALGGDSILTLQVVSRAARVGLRLTPKQVFENPTVARLATVAGVAPAVVAEQGWVSGEAPLTPIQQWFFEHPRRMPEHFNQAVLLQARERIKPSTLAALATNLTSHHDALRLRFERHDDGWRQWHADPDASSAAAHWIDLTALDEGHRRAVLEAAAKAVQGSLDLTLGPLARFVGFDLGDGSLQRLLVVVHHLAVDGVSWRILLQDLEQACRAVAGSKAIALPAKTTSYRAWAEHLVEVAGEPRVQQEAADWLGSERAPVRSLPLDTVPLNSVPPTTANTVGSVDSVRVTLPAEPTRDLLREVPRAYRARIDEALLAAVGQVLRDWIGGPLWVDVEGHGRETEPGPGAGGADRLAPTDLSRTVGWFTAIHPLWLDLGETTDPGRALRQVKEALRRAPLGGLAYGLLRYLGGDEEITHALRRLPAAEVSFNYLGQTDLILPRDSLLAPAPESAGAAQPASEGRRYLLEIDGWIEGDELQLTLRFSRELHQRATIEGLAENLRSTLEGLATHCRDAESRWTPVDLPLLDLQQQELDDALAAVTFHGAEGGTAEIEDAYWLSPMQEGLLFHSLQQAGSGVYVTQIVARLRQLEPETLVAAWDEVMARHPILRTAVSLREGDRALQVVGRRVELPVTLDDWSHLSAVDVDARLERALAKDRGRGFDPSRAPLMRLQLIALSGGRHLLLWSHHHLLLDGWSTPIVLSDVFRAYGALRQGKAVELEERRPYRDYIAWLERQDTDAAESFWRERLRGFTAPTPLGVARTPGQSDDLPPIEPLWRRLNAAETSALRDFAQANRLTVSSIVQGAWAVLISRYSGEPEVVFGSVDSGRPADLPGADSMVGLFINTLPVRAGVPATAETLPWLAQFQARQVEQRELAFTPLAEIRRWSEVPAGQPLFESFVAFENYPLDETLGGGGTEILLEDVQPIESTHFPLALTVLDTRPLALRLEVAPDRFDSAAAGRVLAHLHGLLADLSSSPDRRLGSLSLLSPAERHQLVCEWSDTGELQDELCVHHLLQRQVALTPTAIAAVFQGQQLTYAELAGRVDALAEHLLGLGVTVETSVAICLERSLDMLIATLGVLQAGGAYVPLDPAYPAARLAYVLEDSQAALLLSEAAVVARLEVPAGIAVSLAADWPLAGDAALAAESSGPWPAVVGRNLAYIIYTSGSTGRPKGVEVRHGAVVNFLQSMARRPGLAASDGLLSVTTLAFDIHVLELYLPLAVGARVEIASRATSTDGRELVGRLQAASLTAMQATPATWQLLIESDWQDESLTALCGGEALSPILAAELQRRAGAAWNLYGPTETTVWSA
ncbi:MAG: non-ribosomal peptide synthase/polyketide synthase, partial [Acidobacteriota bacterium]